MAQQKKAISGILMIIILMGGVYAQYYNPNTQPQTYYAGYNTNAYNPYGTSTYNTNYNNQYGYQNVQYNTQYGNTQYGYNQYQYNQYGNTQYGYNGGSNYYQSTYPNSGFNGFSNTQTSTYWPQLSGIGSSGQQCDGTTSDFLIQIPLGGCTPNVIRSDLLAEQNVPVFCKLSTLKLNPLIDSSAIQSISFSGDYPDGVSGISYHPGRQALRNYNTVLGSPAVDDAGYVVITLKRQADERELPQFIEGNITARIRYDGRQLLGTSHAEYYLEAGDGLVPFWQGKGFLEVESVSNGVARINVYTDRNSRPIQSFTLGEGQRGPLIYLPGYYCTAGAQVVLNRIVAPDNMALLNVDGDQIWVRQGSRFNPGNGYATCTVNNLNVHAGGGGTVDINCAGQRFNLKLGERGTAINNGQITRDYSIGEQIKSGDESYYLAHYGKGPENRNFVLLTKKKLDNLELSVIYNHYNAKDWSSTSTTDFEKSLGETTEGKRRIGQYGSAYFIIYPKTDSDPGSSIGGITVDDIDNNFIDTDVYGVANEMQKGKEIVKELADFYPTESKFTGTYWGEEALYQQILLAGQAGHEATQMELIELFIQKFPSSTSLTNVLELKRRKSTYDSSNSHKSVQINNQFFNIFVESFRAESDLDKSATIRIGGRSAEFVKENDKIELSDGNLTIERIDVNGIVFRFNSKEGRTESRSIRINSFGLIGGNEVEVRDIKSRQVAYVSIIPQVNNNQNSQANFAFKIGIEERNIKLNPDKTADAIKGLNETIEAWEDILDKLGKVIKVWKAVCFATSTILMLETVLDGFDGSSLGRTKIMRKYKTTCDIEIAKGTYQTRTQCYNALSQKIDSDVEKMKNAINSVNEELKLIQQGNTQTQGILGGQSIINQTKYVEDLKKNLKWNGLEINGIKVETKDLTKSTEVSSILLYQKMSCTSTEKSCSNKPKEDIACCSAFEEMKATLGSTAIQKQATTQGNLVTQNIQNIVGGVTPTVQVITSKNTRTLIWNGQTGKDITKQRPASISDKDKIQFLNLDSKTYLIKLKDATLGGSMGIIEAWNLNSNNKWIPVTDLKTDGLNKFVFVGGSSQSCKGNIIKNPEVRFYTSGRNTGLPSIVPFDIQNGWYTYVPNSQGSFLQGTQQTYTSAGDVNFFWICNAGKNGIVEQKSGDDLCQSFSSNQVGFNTFLSCGIQGQEVTQLYSKARNAIRQAAQGYSGGGYINILGQNIKTGNPVSDVGGTECQDFMSPGDCKLLFNACDPVICPSSRCNLGGKYPVSNVVQTGIIGSIALCLPNAREGIAVPICLTGIHAGLDALVSVLKSEKLCLERNLATGEYVGICDEITAIYMCELLWRDFGSILNVVLPSLTGSLFGQPVVTGGGEYLSVQSAWNNLQKSTEFFTGTYAQNVIVGFNSRSSQNIGTEVCNGFLGTSVPIGLSAEGFDALLSPESPTQFYAYFSEIPYTDATSPTTSHYKVYYHIYAGNDFGTSYQVYLKNPSNLASLNTGSGFGLGNTLGGNAFNTGFNSFGSNQIANVRSGYVPRGESADEAIDFTGPSGYKELCVRINNQEHCGFGTVSSSFAVNYATERYTESQATRTDITTEGECVSTSASAWGLVAPNVQAGVETAIGGRDINLAGITRVCATQNPEVSVASPNNQVVCSTDTDCGSGSICRKNSGSDLGNCVDRNGNIQQSLGRWIDVGYCSDPNLRCWLDSASIQNRFNAINAVNQELYGITGTVEDQLRYGQLFQGLQQSYELARSILSQQYNKIISLTPGNLRAGDSDPEISLIIQELDKVIGVYTTGVGTSNNKAEALALKATIYRMIVEQKMKDQSGVIATGITSVPAIVPVAEQISPNIQPNSQDNIAPTNTVSISFTLIESNGKQHISYGSSVSRAYFQVLPRGATVIRIEGSSKNVGSIDTNGLIFIQSTSRNEPIGVQTLGDIHDLYYSDQLGFHTIN